MSVGLSDTKTLFGEFFRTFDQPPKHRRKYGEQDVVVVVQGWGGQLELKRVQAGDVASVVLRTRYSKPPADIQSGIIQRSAAACEQAAYGVRMAHQHLPPEEAVRTIGTIWENIDKTGQLAEARTRICLAKLEQPRLVERPTWLTKQLEHLSQAEEELAPSHPLAIESADRLIRACLFRSNAAIEAGVQKAPLGNVLVDWDIEPHSLQWEVEAARLPWPGVKVNALVVDNSGEKPQAHTRIFHTAFEVIEHFSEQLHELGVETGMSRCPTASGA